MFKFFEQIAGAIAAVFDFVITIFTNLFSFFGLIGESLFFLLEVVFYLPAPVQAGILCIISISVIYLIVGR